MTSSDDLRHYAIEVKPIGAACNLRCQYCYYLAKGGGHAAGPSLMTDEVLENYIRQVIDIHGRYAEIEFAWHGGEPTMCGIPFFERAMALQQKYGEGRQILNTLQTNGTLLTDEWCQFFRNHQFRIVISIDVSAAFRSITVPGAYFSRCGMVSVLLTGSSERARVPLEGKESVLKFPFSRS